MAEGGARGGTFGLADGGEVAVMLSARLLDCVRFDVRVIWFIIETVFSQPQAKHVLCNTLRVLLVLDREVRMRALLFKR